MKARLANNWSPTAKAPGPCPLGPDRGVVQPRDVRHRLNSARSEPAELACSATATEQPLPDGMRLPRGTSTGSTQTPASSWRFVVSCNSVLLAKAFGATP